MDIKTDLKGFINGSFFNLKPTISNDDISALQAYNEELTRIIGYKQEAGKTVPVFTSAQTAFNRALQNASIEAQNLAASAKESTVNLEQIPKASKASQIALQGLATAGNLLFGMGISIVIGKVLEGISSYQQQAEKAKQRALDSLQTITEDENNLITLIGQYNSLDQTDRSIENTKTIQDLNNQINKALGNQAENIDLVNGKLDEENNKLQRNLLQKLNKNQQEIDTSVSVAKSDYNNGLKQGIFGLDPWGKISRALNYNNATTLDNQIFNNIGEVLRTMDTDQQIKQLKQWLEVLTKADNGKGKYGKELAILQNWYNKLIDNKETYQNAFDEKKKNEIQQVILEYSLNGKIADKDSFEKYKNNIKNKYQDNSIL